MKHIVALTILLLLVTLVCAQAADNPPEIPQYQGPDTTLTLDKIAGAYTFWRQTDEGYENGFIEFKIDHSWTMVLHLDRDRDRVTDEHHVHKGEYAIRRRDDGAVTVWLREDGAQDAYLSDLLVVGGKAKAFMLSGRAFTRHLEGTPFFVVRYNQPIVAELLVVLSEPAGAAVFINGMLVEGHTPLSIKKPLANVALTVRVAKIDYHPQSSIVTLKPGGTQRLSFKLTKGEAGLRLTSTPWVKVRLDGVFFGATPLERDHLQAGPHKIELYNESLQLSRVDEVILEEGKFLEKHYAFNGQLILDVGRECVVFRHGKKAGTTPFAGSVPVGRHVLILEDAQGRRRQLVVRVRLDEVTRVEKTFGSLPKAEK